MLQKERIYTTTASERHFVRKPNFKKTREERLEIQAAKIVHSSTLKAAGYNPKVHLNTAEVRRQIRQQITSK